MNHPTPTPTAIKPQAPAAVPQNTADAVPPVNVPTIPSL